MKLTLGVRHHVIDDADDLLLRYRFDSGYVYYGHPPSTPPNEIVPEDVWFTVLMNSWVSEKTVKSVLRPATKVDLSGYPDTSLETSSEDERVRLAGLITEIASWPEFAASTATKTLHPKRPSLIPVLDNQAIFGAYMNKATWPEKTASGESVVKGTRVRAALDQIHMDLNLETNQRTLSGLQELEPDRSLIEILDMVWWMYFRTRNKKPKRS